METGEIDEHRIAPGTPGSMKQRTTQTLFNYWDGVRAGRVAPRRLEIEPSSIAGILSETFMLECTDGDYLFRLAGSRLCELLGYELRGTSFLAGWTRSDQIILEQKLATVREESVVAHLAMEAGIDDSHSIELEVLLLPLLHSGDRVGRLIGAMSPITQPHWLDKSRLTTRRLLRHELVRPLRRGEGGRAGEQTPFLPALTSARLVRSEHRQFRVLEGGLSKPRKA